MNFAEQNIFEDIDEESRLLIERILKEDERPPCQPEGSRHSERKCEAKGGKKGIRNDSRDESKQKNTLETYFSTANKDPPKKQLFTCGICLDANIELSDMISLSCQPTGHMFCIECFRGYW